MGEAYVCDKCGTLGHEPAGRVWELYGGIGSPPLPQTVKDDYYLCESCLNDFHEFM